MHLVPESAEEALLVVGFARFAEARKRVTVWKDYRRSYWFESLLVERDEPVGQALRLSPVPQGTEVFEDAVELRVLARPLVGVTGPEDVKKLVDEIAPWWDGP